MAHCLKYERSYSQLVKAHFRFTEYHVKTLSEFYGQEASAPCFTQEFFGYHLTSGFEDYVKNPNLKIPNSVPAVFGATIDEGIVFLGILIARFLLPNHLEFNREFLSESMIPLVLQSCGLNEESRNSTYLHKVQDEFFYPGEIGNLEAMIPGLTNLLSTCFIKRPTYEFALLNSRSAPTQFYSFNFRGSTTFADLIVRDYPEEWLPKNGFAGHGDDLIYLFQILTKEPKTRREIRTRENMVHLWKHFAKTGHFALSYSAKPSLLSDYVPDFYNEYLAIDDYVQVKRNYPSTFSARTLDL